MFIDFAELKKTITIEQAMIALAIKLRAERGAYRGECPRCKAGGSRALIVTPEKSVFYCHAAKKGGDQISLVAHINGTGMKEAAQFLLDRSAGADKKTVPHKNEERTNRDVFQPLSHLAYDHEAVLAIGISAEDAGALGIGYASRGILKGYVCVPVRDANGFLNGYVGIKEGKTPKTWHYPQTNVVPITTAKKRA